MNETHAGPTHANPNAGSTSRPKRANRSRERRKHPCSLARRGRRPPPSRRLRPAPRWRAGNRLAPVSGRRRRRPTRCQAEQRPRARAPGAPPAPSLPRRHRRLASARARPRLLRLVIRIAAARTLTLLLLEGGAARRHVGSTQPTLRRAGRPLACLVQRGRVITLIDTGYDRRDPHDAVHREAIVALVGRGPPAALRHRERRAEAVLG